MNTKEALAREFSRVLRSWLTPEQMAALNERNRALVENVCASHNFCDANEAMADAFKTVTGRSPRSDSDHDAALWSDAWSMAKDAQFFEVPTTEPAQGFYVMQDERARHYERTEEAAREWAKRLNARRRARGMHPERFEIWQAQAVRFLGVVKD